uniref:Glycoprotein hormones alpha chain n=1 Tax=Salmo trutta TaxID=8032 RepID=A0A674DK19_SALTR
MYSAKVYVNFRLQLYIHTHTHTHIIYIYTHTHNINIYTHTHNIYTHTHTHNIQIYTHTHNIYTHTHTITHTHNIHTHTTSPSILTNVSSSLSSPPAGFNVTIRSDQRGTCKGTHVVYACVGYCESSAFPSRYSVLVASNFTHNITSASQCCTISKDAKIKVRLDCPRGRHHDDIEILTAQACRCDMCRKSRY